MFWCYQSTLRHINTWSTIKRQLHLLVVVVYLIETHQIENCLAGSHCT